MVPSPAPWAVLGDVLWCLGLGCLLGAVRDGLRLLPGEGPVRCFFRDIATFAAAAVLVCGFAAGAGAAGTARWYMGGAVLLGAVSRRLAVQPAVHRMAAAAAGCLLAPLRFFIRPMQKRLSAALSRRCARKKSKKSVKKQKNSEKQLQKPSAILYN